jgi:hypothetical protein
MNCPPHLLRTCAKWLGIKPHWLSTAITDLLGTDVDAQRHNPLALLRTAAIASGEVLAQHGIAPVVRDDFEVRTFPGDHYRLVPASWGDVDPSLQEAGITWGAWKAATVMHRRREEGRR